DFLSIAVPRQSGRQPNAAEARQWIPHARYADSVLREFEQRSEEFGLSERLARGEKPRSIFFGGGTPSLWDPEELGRVLHGIRQKVQLSPDEELEITVECNPTSVDRAHFEALRSVGVNRVSVGVQSTNDQQLKFLGRLHNSDGALHALEAALEANLPQVSGDLIYGVYRQSPEQAVQEVRQVAQLPLQHLSAYMLTIEPGTRFGLEQKQGRLPTLDDEMVAASFLRVRDALKDEGFEHYEISNFSREGSASIHNLGYWLGRDYIGLGTGAYGTWSKRNATKFRYRNLISAEQYMTQWTEGVQGPPSKTLRAIHNYEELDSETILNERLILGLRTQQGVLLPFDLEKNNLSQLGLAWHDLSAKRLTHLEGQLQKQLAQGKMLHKNQHWSIAPEHWLKSDAIILELL
ncbi:MAG: coproporphyrinogen III oxidase family protein, partial [Polyangiaceae bacterium]|nr:coproporphyrinogen III oxidase family protein [Polyangiaceae bacterium]